LWNQLLRTKNGCGSCSLQRPAGIDTAALVLALALALAAALTLADAGGSTFKISTGPLPTGVTTILDPSASTGIPQAAMATLASAAANGPNRTTRECMLRRGL
jgi:hypothetical protein